MKEKRGPETPAKVRALLAAAREAGTPATLIFRLENALKLSPASVQDLSSRLLAEAGRASGAQPHRHKVLANLGCLIVSAPAAFLESLSLSPHITSVLPSDAAVAPIAPVRRGPANSEGWSKKSPA